MDRWFQLSQGASTSMMQAEHTYWIKDLGTQALHEEQVPKGMVEIAQALNDGKSRIIQGQLTLEQVQGYGEFAHWPRLMSDDGKQVLINPERFQQVVYMSKSDQTRIIFGHDLSVVVAGNNTTTINAIALSLGAKAEGLTPNAP